MKETILEEERVLPVLAVRGLVVFPGMIVQFDIGRKKSILAAKAALDTDSRELFIVTQTDLSESEPVAEDLYKIGVIARIKQVVHTTEGGIKLHVEGIRPRGDHVRRAERAVPYRQRVRVQNHCRTSYRKNRSAQPHCTGEI